MLCQTKHIKILCRAEASVILFTMKLQWVLRWRDTKKHKPQNIYHHHLASQLPRQNLNHSPTLSIPQWLLIFMSWSLWRKLIITLTVSWSPCYLSVEWDSNIVSAQPKNINPKTFITIIWPHNFPHHLPTVPRQSSSHSPLLWVPQWLLYIPGTMVVTKANHCWWRDNCVLDSPLPVGGILRLKHCKYTTKKLVSSPAVPQQSSNHSSFL